MKKRFLFIPSIALTFILFLLGTFFDLEISKGIANINIFFPHAVAGLSLFPLCLVIGFIGGSFIRLIIDKKYKKIYQNILLGVFGIAFICFAAFLFGKEMTSVLAFNLAKKWIIPLGIIAAIPGALLGYFLFKYLEKKDYVKKVIYLSITLVICFGIVFVMKHLAPRARYVVIVNQAYQDYYRPWYSPSLTKEMIDVLKATSLGKEAIQSFPSGHSSSAILVMILLTSLPLFIKKLRGKETLLFIIGFIYYLLIAFTRVYSGAHYLSDVAFTGVINLSVYFIANEIYLRKIIKR